MSWLWQLSSSFPVAHAVGVIALVCCAGMALGSVKLRGVGLGTAGVLFAGIIAGHFGKPVDRNMLDFVKEFGLILFVFTMGLQLGPGFFAAFRQQGIKLNLLAAGIVLLGALMAPLIGWLAGFDMAAVMGIFCGSSVNMPSLGAVTQTLGTLPGISSDRLALPAQACAVTFPTAILSSIVTLALLKRLFHVDLAREAAERSSAEHRATRALERRTLVVTNPNLEGVRLDAMPARARTGVTISRIHHGSEVHVATNAAVLHVDDRVTVVGTPASLDEIERVIGPRTDEDLVLAQSDVTVRKVVVTNRPVLGKSIGELHIGDRFGVTISRVRRADTELSAVGSLELQFGDQAQIVGRQADIDKAADYLGDSVRALDQTQFIPMFLGICLGVILGVIPLRFPGLPQPVRLGLAGGPLMAALLLGRLGHFRRLVFYMPATANVAFREFGIALFFAAVGLDAGAKFFRTVFSAVGGEWLLAGVCVTVVPLVIIAIVARSALRMSYADLVGLLAGGTTNPPALSFGTSVTGSEAPAVAYATVYPLTMLLRILIAQTSVLLLCQ